MNLYTVKHSDKYYLVKNCGEYDIILISDYNPEILRKICKKLNNVVKYVEANAFSEYYELNGHQTILQILNRNIFHDPL